jgi:hypothetical protein
MRKIRTFFTVFFLLISLSIILFFALYEKQLLVMLVGEIQNYIIPAGIAVLVFLILLSAGIVSHSHRESGSLFGNGLFQLAILELFICSASLAYYYYYRQQPGQIIIRLEPEKVKDQINLRMKYQSPRSVVIDTIKAPAALSNQSPGNYTFEIIDQDVVYFHTGITLEPGKTNTVTIPVVLDFHTLAVQTEPEGAEIWIDGSLMSKTPGILDIFNKDSIMVELKMQGYQTYVDTVAINENIDLGIIPLYKLYTLKVYCDFSDLDYKIYDMNNNVLLDAIGTKSIQLVQGRYRIAFNGAEGLIESKTFSLNNNYTLYLP